ncbi:MULTISPECIES: succinyl-diaminopimelate desuccinylase [unclassified Pseudoalteromonas]|uniref:succinyl-diaminopimelate desuccinylase n=1 Tax=unclassified Pseudoalteromonas TaxID=194690 RepID=UPI000C06A51F|nr:MULTISPECIES: succinyl-diaminopimelate desuccinylase [unclassified Pseudoalteromonas]MDP2635243.1 succinyl-diaminopimelate desuccinylase [Pseudoalteromonas sp. 1_MG-2023]PHN90933.1 succinyl-diaminopimelate desuccinylase [Pseudoalteromonas sp. 3D05]
MTLSILPTLSAKENEAQAVVDYLQTLIKFNSVTPYQAGAIDWIESQLDRLGFECEQFTFNNVTNLIAKIHLGDGPIYAFSGHIDVVPATAEHWCVAPFSGAILNDAVYGRGAADMKGGVAAMLRATEQLVVNKEAKKGTFYWLITSDEEGEAEYGSLLIAERLAQQGVKLDGCIVGEPTSNLHVGDTIKNGRRGALSARLNIKGKAGHVAYPENTINAAHLSADVVKRLTNIDWSFDEPGSNTSLQVTGINIDNVVDNMVPAQCEVTFNVRYSHGYKSADIKNEIQFALGDLAQNLNIEWERPCESFYTSHQSQNCLLAHVEQAVLSVTGSYPLLSTSGGTSDGRFFANNHTQVIECGVRNNTIHQVNEHVPIDDLVKIESIYTTLLTTLFRC